MRLWMSVAALLTTGSVVSAQIPPPPDPATVTMPDMTPTTDPDVIEDGWKYFYFHRAGVGYAEAYADFAECYRFLPPPAVAGSLPAFTPWSEPLVPRPFVPGPNPYGIIGVGIAALVAGPIERRAFQTRMRRCMETRGYVRYPLRKSAWEQLIEDYSDDSIARQAIAASGPTPNLPQVTR